MKERIHILDILRGIAALGVVLFHHAEWYYGRELTASDLLSRFGTYGVSLFFVLSGFTLRSLYQPDSFNLTRFLSARFFRIYPLMILIVITYYLLNPAQFNLSAFALEVTGMQGLVNAPAYQPVWLWSIGNELVFYLCFPFLIYLERFKKYAVILLCALLVLINGIVFSNGMDAEYLWKLYANPVLNMVFFTLGYGMVNFKNSIKKINSSLAWVALAAGCILFVFFPQNGPKLALALGINRCIYLIVLGVILMASYRLFKELKVTKLNSILIQSGIISYGVYMYHPVVFKAWSNLLELLQLKAYASMVIGNFTLYNLLWFGGSILLTPIVAYFSYYYFEKQIMMFSKRKMNS